eukprot:g2781.t1
MAHQLENDAGWLHTCFLSKRGKLNKAFKRRFFVLLKGELHWTAGVDAARKGQSKGLLYVGPGAVFYCLDPPNGGGAKVNFVLVEQAVFGKRRLRVRFEDEDDAEALFCKLMEMGVVEQMADGALSRRSLDAAGLSSALDPSDDDDDDDDGHGLGGGIDSFIIASKDGGAAGGGGGGGGDGRSSGGKDDADLPLPPPPPPPPPTDMDPGHLPPPPPFLGPPDSLPPPDMPGPPPSSPPEAIAVAVKRSAAASPPDAAGAAAGSGGGVPEEIRQAVKEAQEALGVGMNIGGDGTDGGDGGGDGGDGDDDDHEALARARAASAAKRAEVSRKIKEAMAQRKKSVEKSG